MNSLLARFFSRINNKLILLSVIPVLIVTLIITYHTIGTRQAEIRDYHLKTAAQLAKNLAKISDFALYSGREDILEPLATSAREIPSIAEIVFLDPGRAVLLGGQSASSLTTNMLATGDYQGLNPRLFVVEEPVYLQDVDVSDYNDHAENSEATLLGWVVVVADNTEAATKARQILTTHLLISLSVMLGAILLTYVLSHSVVAPVVTMTRVVRELERGNLDARIVPSTRDELAILANGINHLAKTVAEGRENLEAKVARATQKLTQTLADITRNNQELDAARLQAETANVAKGDFLAQMSHELRTPITAIQGFVRLLAASDLKPSNARYCTIIQQAAIQLLQLIDDILDITRLQTHAIAIDRMPFLLSDCIEAPVSLMAPTAHAKGLELILDIHPTVPLQLVGDSLRIRQIIYNLLSNAIKFTPSGYVRLKVNAEPMEGGVRLLIQVSDTGIGIPEQQQQKIFDPFSQADTSISRRFGGSGLGLAIVKQLVDLMAGDIRLESMSGKGTAFSLRLPMTRCDALAEELLPSVHCVLLFDAHPQSRQALEHRLSRYVEVINSCESFEDLEIGELQPQPELVIYSSQVTLPTTQMVAEITRLHALCHRPMAVFAPATIAHKDLPGALLDSHPDITFLDKPPLSSELAKLFHAPSDAAGGQGAVKKTALNARIMIADDNEFTRILLETFFENSGCNLTMTTNGAEAVAACDHQPFDLILLDVHMPDINGIAALKAIRAQGVNRTTPVIMLTADILQQEEKNLFAMGASDLVFKPFDEEKLLAVVHKHLKTVLPATDNNAITAVAGKHKKLFSQEIKRLTELAKAALLSKDGEALREAVHQLLGIAGVYHMTYLERAVQAVHQAIKSGNGNKVVAAMDTLNLEVSKLMAESGDHSEKS